MGLPHEGSVECEDCGTYNIQNTNCVIVDGDAYCENCSRKRFNTDFGKLTLSTEKSEEKKQ